MRMVVQLIRATAAAALVAFVVVFVRAWTDAPEIVPSHFDGHGNPDAWGTRNVMWWTMVGTALAGCTTLILSFFPRLYNFPWSITEENRKRQYRLAEALIAFVSVCVATTGLLITLAQVSESPQSLIRWVWWATGSMVAGVAGYFVAAWRAR